MSVLSNFLNSIRLNQDEDYDGYDEDFEEDDDEPRRSSLFSRRNSRQEDDYIDDDEPEAKPKLFGKSKVAPISSARRSAMEVTMIKPTSMEDSQEICKYLREGKAVVLNLEGMHMELAQRIIDFTSGAAFAIDGNLQKISQSIFIASPPNIELSGDFQNLLASTGNLDVNGLSKIRL